MSKMLEIRNVTKVFNPQTINENIALNNLSIDVQKGDYITIIGSNGAGKSTLFNAICGNYLVDQGAIILDGENITFKDQHKRSKYIGRLFQDPLKGTAPTMTIEENLALAYLRAGSKTDSFSRISKKDQEVFRDQLAQLEMGLEDRMHTQVGTLSGGQRQALTLLMATIVPPKLLLLDEHTAALDPQAAKKIMDLTNEIVERNHTTCMMVTHNLNQAIHTGNRLIMMSFGKIVKDYRQEEKQALTIDKLMKEFKENAGRELDNDRMLLQEEE